MYNDKYIKTKIKNYNNGINTNLHGNKISEGNECCACLSVRSSDSIVIEDEKYNPQIFLEECKYAVKKKNMINAINKELDLEETDKENNVD